MSARVHHVLLLPLSALLLCGCNLGGGVDLDAQSSVDAEVEAEMDGGGSDGGDADREAGEPGGGRIVQVVRSVAFLEDRLCDLDGDGVADNAIADLGEPQASIFAAAISTLVDGSLIEGDRFAFDLPWVADISAPSGSAGNLLFYGAEDIGAGRTPEDDYSGHDAFFAEHRYLSPCGEPLFFATDASLEEGQLLASTPLLSMGISDDVALIFHQSRLEGRVEPFGRSSLTTLCGIAIVSDLGDTPGLAETDLSLLEEMLIGGRVFGVPSMTGLSPDVDVDGDGLERVLVDDDGRVTACIDGDLTMIPGWDCYRDPRMADGVSINVAIEGVGARFAGREPGWEYQFAPPCDDGLAAESLFDSPADSFGPCADSGDVCDPRSPEPCCDPSQVCSGANTQEYLCVAPCEPSTCEYGLRLGVCRQGAPGCLPAADAVDAEEASCILGEGGCTTEYGTIEGARCVEWGTQHLCLEPCDVPAAECETDDPDHHYHCEPLVFGDGGACVPEWSSPEE